MEMLTLSEIVADVLHIFIEDITADVAAGTVYAVVAVAAAGLT
jgi:hypothetical protein